MSDIVNSDYYVKMLRLYFTDINISETKKAILLADNPFNYKFTKWEDSYIRGNKAIAREIKELKLIDSKTNVREVTGLDEESISKYLFFDNNSIKNKNIILMRDISVGNKTYLTNAIKNNRHFILGYATPYRDTYLDKLRIYKQLINKKKDIEMIREYEDGLNICIIRK